MATKTETIEHKLYDWTVIINFYPNSHRYKKPDEKGWIRSVTSITGIVEKPFLKQWAVDMAIKYLDGFLQYQGAIIGKQELEQARTAWDKVSQEAKDIWHDVHEYIEWYISYEKGAGEKPVAPIDDKAKKWVIAFLKWKKEHNVEFLHSEKLVYSKEHNYCGIFDDSYIKDWLKFLSDSKTSKSIYEDYITQTVGYVIAYEEEFPNEKSFDWISIKRFDKETGEFEMFELLRSDPLFDKAKKCFLSCLNLKNTNDEFKKVLTEFYKEKNNI